MFNLENNKSDDIRLAYQIERLASSDSFHAFKQACSLLENGVWAVFGPRHKYIDATLSSLSARFNLPHFQTHFHEHIKRLPYSISLPYTVNLYPHSSIISKGVLQLIDHFKLWQGLTLIYQTNEELVKMKDIINISAKQISIRQYQGSFRKLFNECKKKGETNFIVSTQLDQLTPFLIQARKSGLLTEYNNIIFTNLDANVIELKHFQQTDANIISLAMINEEGNYRLKLLMQNQTQSDHLHLQIALLFDYIQLFTKALNRLNWTQPFHSPSLSCEGRQAWSLGDKIIRLIKKTSLPGYTGEINLDQNGQRVNLQLDVVKLKQGKFQKIGSWKAVNSLKIVDSEMRQEMSLKEKLQKKTLKVASFISSPFVMVKENHHQLSGNDKFEGFCIDLLEKLKNYSNFADYQMEVIQSSPAPYSLRDQLIDKLRTREVDMVIGDFTITQERSSLVDFTIPFMSFGVSLLYHQTTGPKFDLFSFLNLFASQLWLRLLVSFILITILMYLMESVSVTLDKGSNYTQIYLSNFAWLAVCSMLHQTSNINPRSLSTRTLAAFWKLSTLLIVCSYTASLIAHLAKSRMTTVIKNPEDFLNQNVVKFGCVKDGSTYHFLKNSNSHLLQRVFKSMDEARPSVYVNNYQEGLERVLNNDYALLMETPSIVYYVNRFCNLTQIGELLDNKEYGLVLPLRSPYLNIFSSIILKLIESGEIEALSQRWFHDYPYYQRLQENPKSLKCSQLKSKPTSWDEIKVDNIKVLFVVLFIGISVASILVIFEFVWKSKRGSQPQHGNDCIPLQRQTGPKS